MVKYMFMPDSDDKKKAVAAFMKEGFAYWAGKFEARLEENEKRGNKNGFFVGDAITIADLKFVGTVGGLARVGKLKEVKETYKRIATLMDAVDKNEKIVAFKKVFAANMAAAGEGKME